MKNSKKSSIQSISPLRLACFLSILFGCALTASFQALAQAPVPASPAIEAKAHAWLAKLTLEQKIELIGGVDDMYTHCLLYTSPTPIRPPPGRSSWRSIFEGRALDEPHGIGCKTCLLYTSRCV